MPESRIFIGNLNIKVKEKHLEEIFNDFGEITNLELKTKLDTEGEPILWFAYLNLKSDQQGIDNCIKSLNGSSLKGSVLNVQIARESFLDRLKREREENANKESNDEKKGWEHRFNENSSFDNDQYKFKTYDETEFKSRANFREYNDDNFIEDLSYNYKYKAEDEQDYINDSTYTADYTENLNLNPPSFRFPKDGRNESDRLLPAFQRYDPTKDDKSDVKSPFVKGKNDPGLKKVLETEKFVKISGELEFKTENSSSFSFLQKFEENLDNEPFVEEDLKPEQEIRSCITDHDFKPKTRNFFIKEDDPELKEAVNWLTTPLTEKGREEYYAIRPDLVSLYHLRHRRALKIHTERSTFGDFVMKGTDVRRPFRKSGRGRGRGRANK